MALIRWTLKSSGKWVAQGGPLSDELLAGLKPFD
jgi:hypothetical protein